MRAKAAGLSVITALSGLSTAMKVADGSPCYQNCGNVPGSTNGSEIVCDENSVPGSVFQTCIGCEAQSTFSNNKQTDLQWLLYNLRYSLSWCLWGYPGNKNVGDSPCITSTACGPLQQAVEWKNLTTQTGAFDFCEQWNGFQVTKCSDCLRAGDNHFLNNYLIMLDAACSQEPAVGSALSIQGSPFSSTQVTITTPTPAPLYTITPDNSPISLPGKVGIAVGGFVVLLALVGCGIVCNGRRRRRAFLRRLRKEHAPTGWPTPNHAGNDMFETPLSQKPLRGWEDSPVSAATENTFPRYFSPYSSQFNSPVSAVEGPSTMPWPTATQEKAAQAGADPGLMPSAMEIGLALGGSDPSLKTQPSNQSIQSHGHQWEQKGKRRDESYELREVDNNSDILRIPDPPVLQHPGYGRNNTPPHSRYGGLTEDDARRGNAL